MEEAARQDQERLPFPQISSQVSNLPFAGSRHQTNPAMYRFMRSQESVNPGGGDLSFCVSGSGVHLCGAHSLGQHLLAQINSIQLTNRNRGPQLEMQVDPHPRSEPHEPRITRGSRLSSSQLVWKTATKLPLPCLALGLATRWAIVHPLTLAW